MRHLTHAGLVAVLAVFAGAGAASGALAAGKTERVSVGPGGRQGNGYSGDPSPSGNGRAVAFASDADNLVAGDRNGERDVFVRDRRARTTVMVSVGPAGVPANGYSSGPLISRQGRRVVFESMASNLVPNDTNGRPDVFLRDLEAGTTTRVSVATGGGQVEGASVQATAISEDAGLVAFALNFAGDEDQAIRAEVHVRDVLAGTTTREDRNAAGQPGDGHVYDLALSADGRYLAFESDATNLVRGAADGTGHVYLRDRVADTLTLVDVDQAGAPAAAGGGSPAIAGDGRTVGFSSRSPGLAPGAVPPERYLAYVRDLPSGRTTRLDLVPGGLPDRDVFVRGLSRDGRQVLVDTAAALSPLDTNGRPDLYAFDRATGVATLASARGDGRSARDGLHADGGISGNGRFVAFDSEAGALVPGDTNDARDVFVRQLPARATP